MVPANKTKISENYWKIIFGRTFFTNAVQRNKVNSVLSTNPRDKARPQHWELRALLFKIK